MTMTPEKFQAWTDRPLYVPDTVALQYRGPQALEYIAAQQFAMRQDLRRIADAIERITAKE